MANADFTTRRGLAGDVTQAALRGTVLPPRPCPATAYTGSPRLAARSTASPNTTRSLDLTRE